jgi:hypothetical protein
LHKGLAAGAAILRSSNPSNKLKADINPGASGPLAGC